MFGAIISRVTGDDTTADADPTPTQPAASADDLATAVANQRRRIVLRTLADEGAADADTLATTIAGVENGKPPELVTSTERNRVYIALTQGHLEKLDDCGLIHYDDRAKTVAPAEDIDAGAHLVEELHETAEGQR
ncbi:hypothetical protein NDI85_19710 [Halomicroarcula sp. S1AR25-4]|uniref:DUF7344 domain-containing protein n=1 Tax=Haloarcula sp. S1AR25-4 TaxID=2950538 RepID=UPI0028740B47|nr:hypothetical protein [Halomicroarcula sp. S1AR25-4]MDS0280015.1 hypothetical protein [Halomicroarcula sp. S1AR25-4]